MSNVSTRRQLLKSVGILVLLTPVLQACSQAAPTPAPAAKQEAAAKPTAAPAKQEAANPTPKPAAASSGGNISLSIATYAGPNNDWQRDWAKIWVEKNPNVNLKIDEIVYSEMPQKQLAMLATNTMQDVVFSGIKWFPYSAAKGAFMPVDDLIKANDPGMDDFFSAAIAGSGFEGKLYGLPYLMHPGNPALIVYNQDLLEQKGIKPPTDDWAVEDFVEIAMALTNRDNKIFGTNYFPSNYYDFCSLARTWGGDIMADDNKKFTFATDPKSVEAAQWAVDLRVKHKATPDRAEREGLQFPAGQLATTTAGTYSVLGLGKTVGDKFKWDAVLFPKGPTGIRGYQGFVETFSIYAKSKQPEKAFDLLATLTSKEAGIWAVVKNSYQPSGRKSVWAADEVNAIHSIFRRALEWMSTTPGAFPIPYNLRFSELQDKWSNTAQPLFYGEVDFNDGMQKVQQACQEIMDLPRG